MATNEEKLKSRISKIAKVLKWHKKQTTRTDKLIDIMIILCIPLIYQYPDYHLYIFGSAFFVMVCRGVIQEIFKIKKESIMNKEVEFIKMNSAAPAPEGKEGKPAACAIVGMVSAPTQGQLAPTGPMWRSAPSSTLPDSIWGYRCRPCLASVQWSPTSAGSARRVVGPRRT